MKDALLAFAIGIVASLVASMIVSTTCRGSNLTGENISRTPSVESQMDAPKATVGEGPKSNTPSQRIEPETQAIAGDSPITYGHEQSKPPSPGVAIVTTANPDLDPVLILSKLESCLNTRPIVPVTRQQFNEAIADSQHWQAPLPTDLLSIKVELAVAKTNRSRFRGESQLYATLYRYDDSPLSFHAHAFGAGFSKNEAGNNAIARASELLCSKL